MTDTLFMRTLLATPARFIAMTASLLLLPLLLAACAMNPAVSNQASQPPAQEESGLPPGIQPLAAPQETPTPAADETTGEADALPQVTVKNRSVNIRSGPGLDYQVVYGAQEGDVFLTVGRTEDGWWRICCVPGPNDEPDQPTEKAWISDRVVTPNDAAAALAPLTPLFPEAPEALWSVDYECRSDRCTIKSCTAQVVTEVRNDEDPRWIEIERKVQWDNACGEDSTWTHQIDRFDGQERYLDSTELFLFKYWSGAYFFGEPNSLYTMPDGRQVQAWCGEPETVDIPEAGGWTNTYRGVACYDVRTGTLVAMHYVKRWLFSGEFEGETYERAYFGDYEVYDIRLQETNIELSFAEDVE